MSKLNLHGQAVDFLREIAARPEAELIALTEAMFAAAEFHGPQRRKDGQLYMIHPLQVASLLARYGATLAAIIAGLLHDVLEDTGIPASELGRRFGHETLRLVEATSKNIVSDQDQLCRMGAVDPQIADLKLADRAANLMQGSALHLNKERHLAKLKETEAFHLGRLAAIPQVTPGLVTELTNAFESSWVDYRSRTD